MNGSFENWNKVLQSPKTAAMLTTIAMRNLVERYNVGFCFTTVGEYCLRHLFFVKDFGSKKQETW
jgi:hypothetical protein